jgi:exodeoxyribonuclease III
MRIATWNVNGIRAREAQVREWIGRERPDVVCLQEIKAGPEQIPALLFDQAGYWCYWHGSGGYSGVALLARRELSAEKPAYGHPPFDHECRAVTAEVGGITVASLYVPNGGKDFAAKIHFLEALERWVGEEHDAGKSLVLCGDLNVTLSDLDVHPRERKSGAVGQRPEERELLERILRRGLVDLGRSLHPDTEGLYTWWPPWREMRRRNMGWRIDYLLASESLATRVSSCEVQAEVGTSDHAPVVAVMG